MPIIGYIKADRYHGPERRKVVDYASQVTVLRFVVLLLAGVVLVLSSLSIVVGYDLKQRIEVIEQKVDLHVGGSHAPSCKDE